MLAEAQFCTLRGSFFGVQTQALGLRPDLPGGDWSLLAQITGQDDGNLGADQAAVDVEPVGGNAVHVACRHHGVHRVPGRFHNLGVIRRAVAGELFACLQVRIGGVDGNRRTPGICKSSNNSLSPVAQQQK